VDDFSQWPGYDGRTMQAMERELVPRMHGVIAVSDTLVEAMARLGARAELLTHGVELAHWAGASAPEAAMRPGASPARIVFWGVIDRRLDLAWVAALGEAIERRGVDARIVLVGPQEDPDPRLFTLPRVECRAAVPYGDLPALASGASVLVMPYGDLPATRAMQPLKLKEYLASGRPAVVRALPATRPWAGACDVCESPEAFVERVLERLETGLPSGQRLARQALDGEDWTEKAARFERAIDPALAAAHAEEAPCHAAC
jgi:glycosyltransferase involved in cell wall biosynthesis